MRVAYTTTISPFLHAKRMAARRDGLPQVTAIAIHPNDSFRTCVCVQPGCILPSRWRYLARETAS